MSSPHSANDLDRTTLHPTEARQAVPVGRLRYVLTIGLALAVGVLAVCYLVFFG